MRVRACAAFSTLLLAFSAVSTRADMPCTSGSGPDGRWVRHASGFEITHLDGHDITCKEDGIAITDRGLPERTATPATVRLLPAEPDFDSPATQLLQTGDLVYYHLDQSDGGSGGTEHRLTAWRELPGGLIVLVDQTVQIEPGFDPFVPAERFALGWSLLARVHATDD